MEKKRIFKNGVRIRVQLLLVLTVCITLFSFVVLFFVKWTAQNIAKDTLKNLVYTYQYDSKNELEFLMKKISASTAIISQDKSIRNYIKTGEDNIILENISGIETFNQHEICGITLLRDNSGESKTIYGGFTEGPSDVILKKSKQFGAYLDLSKTYVNAQNKELFLFTYYTGDAVDGYILIYIREGTIGRIINNFNTVYNVKMLSNDGVCLSSSHKDDVGKRFPVDRKNSQANEITKLSNDDGIVDIFTPISLAHSDTTAILVHTVDYTKLYDQLYIMDSVTVFIAIMMLLVLTGLTLLISIKAVKPIENLKNSVVSYTGEKAEKVTRLKLGRYNEIAELYDSFDDMTDRISELIEKNEEDSEQRRKLELAALQIQINPHFLYNTLDTVAWLSKLKKQPDIEKLVVSLARFFRISLHNGDKHITVFEETQLVKNYINIENIRFPEKINLEMNIDDDILDYKIVKIILQPIVENSIKHGFVNLKRKGTIRINGYASGEDLIFEVIDDGNGFAVPPNFLQKDFKRNDGPGGYGIKNVNERIKLEYGENYGLFYESEPKKGTKVTVKLRKYIEDISKNEEQI